MSMSSDPKVARYEKFFLYLGLAISAIVIIVESIKDASVILGILFMAACVLVPVLITTKTMLKDR